MIINVTQKDINDGKPHKCYECPIALACVRAGLKDVSVGLRNVTFDMPNDEWRRADLPIQAQQFVRAFDACIPVNPFSFELEV